MAEKECDVIIIKYYYILQHGSEQRNADDSEFEMFNGEDSYILSSIV